MKIEIMNPVICRTTKQYAHLLIPALTCKAEYYRKERIPGTDRTRMVRKEYDKHFFYAKQKDYWYFYCGHLERVHQHLKGVGLEPAEIFYSPEIFHPKTIPWVPPVLKGIKFREDQKALMKSACEDQTGVILSPTGSGKTILQLGIMSAYPKLNILLLSHTIGITSQTFEELQKFGFENIQQIGGGVQFNGEFARIVISTIQSFSKIDPELCAEYFNVVMVDEAHRVSSLDNTYAEVLHSLMAPIRLGFTATLPTGEVEQMSLEALLGPVIGELTIGEAAELKILAVPKVKLLKSEFSRTVKDTKGYPNVYEAGITSNSSRNALIASTIIKHAEANDVSLIFVNRIEHGLNLQQKFLELTNSEVPFVNGSMKPEERQNIRHSLMERRRKIAIATTAWREGINIPSLDVIFNAGGGKDELGVLQLIGRGLRRTSGKTEVLIYDIFDESHYFLISHFGRRVTLYMENEWL
jgi:superfamily II DNA or RNA helicase